METPSQCVSSFDHLVADSIRWFLVRRHGYAHVAVNRLRKTDTSPVAVMVMWKMASTSRLLPPPGVIMLKWTGLVSAYGPV